MCCADEEEGRILTNPERLKESERNIDDCLLIHELSCSFLFRVSVSGLALTLLPKFSDRSQWKKNKNISVLVRKQFFWVLEIDECCRVIYPDFNTFRMFTIHSGYIFCVFVIEYVPKRISVFWDGMYVVCICVNSHDCHKIVRTKPQTRVEHIKKAPDEFALYLTANQFTLALMKMNMRVSRI